MHTFLLLTLLSCAPKTAPEAPTETEMTAPAGPPEFDSLWNFSDPAATEVAFRALLPELEAHPQAKLQLQTQIARTLGLQRKFDEANALLDEIEAQLTDADTRTHVRYLLERGRLLNSSGDPDAAVPLFTQAWDRARAAGDMDGLAVDAAHMVAIAAMSDPEVSMAWNLQAMALAESSDDPKANKWLGSLYNNIGWTHHGAGDFTAALAVFEKALAWRIEQESSQNSIWIAHWCIARTLRSLERTEEALAIQERLRDQRAEAEKPGGYVFEELGECLLVLGRAEEAGPWFAQAHALLSQDGWLVANEPERLARLAELGGVAD
jgi:tetratricopeptide (TPR) repeat protein